MKNCPRCGEGPFPDTLQYCYKCSYGFFPPAAAVLPASNPPARRRTWGFPWPWALAALIAAGICLSLATGAGLLASVGVPAPPRSTAVPTRPRASATPSTRPSPKPSGQTSSAKCGSARSPRLKVGGFAYVTHDPPVDNRVRAQPGLSSQIVGYIANGHSMKVLDGPQCADGYYWWRVQATRNANVVGWTAEAEGSTYWLVPCSSQASCP